MANTGQVLANVNFSRYSSAVFVVGQKEVWRAFHWLYHRHHRHEPELYVGDCLRNTPGSMSRIGAKEKAALDRREDPANMDIPLLYRLLQHTCGLAPETSKFTWNKAQSEAEQQRLEHQLYQIKEVRNALCHDPAAFMHMTDAELNTHLEELMKLLCNTVQAAGRRSAQPAAEVEAAVASIRERLTNIQASMPPSAILPQEFALLAKRELAEQWQGCTTWGEVEELSPPLLQWAVEAQEVPLNQLLQGRGEEQSPRVVVVLGEAGIGKSSLCWQLLEAWLQGDQQMPEVVALELVVMVECRQVFTRDLTRLLMEELLPQTCRRCRPEEVLDLLGALRVLWLVDGFEEATPDARSLLCRLVEQCSSGHVVLLTSQHGYLDEVGATLSHVSTQVCHVTHCGLTQRGFRTLLASLLQEPGWEECREPVWGKQCAAFTQEVDALSPDLLQELHNPLKLILAVRLWEEGRLGEATGDSLTDLYAAIQDAFVAKLVAKLRAKSSLAEAETKERVRRWVVALCEEALAMWVRGCFVNLDEEAERHLRDRAVDLLLPYTDCFSTFLGCRVRPGPHHSFLHHTQQSIMAAQHLYSVVLQGHTAEEVKCLLLPGHPDNARLDHFLDMLTHAATSLAAEGNLDEERARVVARLLEQCRFCQWLEVVRCTRCCTTMAHEAHLRLTGTWEVTDDTLQAATTLVRIGAPDAITIQLYRDSRNNPDLLPLLHCLSKSPVKVSLIANHSLQHCLQTSEPLYSLDNLLHPLCGPTSSCHLVDFRGLLTGDGCCALQHHKHTLEFLNVGVLDPLALDQVILLSHQAEVLDSLYIHLLCTLEVIPKMSVSERVDVNLSLVKVEDGEAERAVTLIRRIGHSFMNITLGQVTPATVCRMVQAFRRQKVRALSLGRWITVKFWNQLVYQRHVAFITLPPPPHITLREIYKFWNNFHVNVQLTLSVEVLSPTTAEHTTHTGADQCSREDTGST